MIVLVTGATGLLGRAVVEVLLSRAHAVRSMSRVIDPFVPTEATLVSADLSTGRGLPDAIDGIDALVHCAASSKSAEDEWMRRLIEVAERSGKPHMVLPSTVGCDVVVCRHCTSKQNDENLLTDSDLPWTINRFTQFHETVWRFAESWSRRPVALVPADTRLQPLDVVVASLRIADTVEVGPSGRLPDLGGPQVFTAKALMKSYLAATGRRRPVLSVNFPGIRGAALRAGGLLTPNRADAGRTWNQFVADKLG